MAKTNMNSKAGELARLLNAARSALQRGASNEASLLLQQATQRWAKSQEAWHLFGEVLQHLGNTNGAFVAFRRAAGLEPTAGTSHERLVELALRLDQWSAAIPALEALLAVRANPYRHGQLAVAQQGAGCIEAATACYEAALQGNLSGESPELLFTLHLNLGTCYHQLFRYAEAASQAALAATHATRPEQQEVAKRNQVAALLDAGKVDVALSHLEGAATLGSSYLYALNFEMPYDADKLLREHRAWGQAAERLAANIANDGGEGWAQRRPPARPARLNIGFVSADWREHPVAYFIAGLLRAVDRRRYCCTFFSDVRTPDHVTEALKLMADHWVDSAGLDDSALGAVVKAKEIDVLIDLGSHTSERISFFALKRAPVQLSYLGYPATSGLTTFDAYLTDDLLDPPGVAERHFVEPLVRLGEVSMSYTPPRSAPQVNSLPAHENGYLTFASFSRLQKINDETLSLWAKAMSAAPESRLQLIGKGFSDLGEQARLTQVFQRFGISPQRLHWLGYLTLDHYLAAHGDVDIIFDCRPWSGHTVTAHAAWMGVPTLTLQADHHAGRLASAVMTLLGRSDFVSSSEESFVAKAQYWSANLDALARIRQHLRGDFERSALMDHSALARRFEAAIDDLYCLASE